MPTVLITGSSGLVGSECVRHFHGLGWDVHGMDNNARLKFFGLDGNTDDTRRRLLMECEGFLHYQCDIRDWHNVNKLVQQVRPDLIIHAAAQPSHDLAATRPFDDFETNAAGTLHLLEATRHHAPQAAFCFLSTNKVYGDAPNRMPFKEFPTRYDYGVSADGWEHCRGFNETMPIDQSTHSLFGCSKLAADIYTQEFGKYFGMKTTSLRCGCLTGSAHAAAEQHGFLAYLVRCCKEGRIYRVFGYGGKQVRDQLHAHDVARACEEVWKNPKCGEVFNLGGGRANSVSVLEAIELAEKATGKKLNWEYVDQPRRGDHQVWISDTSKFRSHYPNWNVSISLQQIIDELACGRADPVSATQPGLACNASPGCA